MSLKTESTTETSYILRRCHSYNYDKYVAGGIIVTHDAYPYNGFTGYDTSDTVTKDITLRKWKTLLANGDNATTALSGTKWQLLVRGGLMYSKRKQDLIAGKNSYHETTCTGQMILVAKPTGLSSISTTIANNKALTSFIQQCRRQQTSFQGMTYLGEAAEAIHMLRGNVHDLRNLSERYLRDVKRLAVGESKRPRRSRNAHSFLDRVSGRYLEYTFGISPLVNDVRSAAVTLAKINLGENRNHRLITATATDTSVSDVANSTLIPGDIMRLDSRLLSNNTATVVYRGVVTTGLDTTEQVNRFLGFDQSNFLPTLWELLPYSWLADYVTNIGDMVDAFSFNRSTLRWVARTIIKEQTKKLYDFHMTIPPSAGWTVEVESCMPPSVLWIGKSVDRSTYAGSLVPDYSFQLGGVGWRRTLNMGAVVRQGGSVQRFIRSLFL